MAIGIAAIEICVDCTDFVMILFFFPRGLLLRLIIPEHTIHHSVILFNNNNNNMADIDIDVGKD